MGKINYRAIYEKNHRGWLDMTENPGKYEALLAGHYSDSNHFVYELIQNAEDTKASCVVFEYHEDKIVFYHDGKPFNEADVIGVSSMLETTKADDAQTIGKFGMGFKSVFKYTCEPQIYSDDEAFRIKNYLLPEEIEMDWNYVEQMRSGICYGLNAGEQFIPFAQSEHLTKVVLPFQKREKSGEIHKIDGSDIILKLKELEPEILLFLSTIKCLFWIDKTKGKYEKFSLVEQEDANLKICQLKGNATNSSKRYTDLYYYKYKKKVAHPKMGNAEVSLAFLTNTQQKSIQKMENTDIWVYFPTKDRTGLPCLLHGSFETAVSREKLMRPSEFNSSLLSAAVELFAEAILDFKRRELITQNFIRQILMTAFNDDTLPGLKTAITRLFLENELIPNRSGKLSRCSDVCVAVPFDMADLSANAYLKGTFARDKEYVLINDEKSAGFSEYYSWLKLDLKVPVFSIESWAHRVVDCFHNMHDIADFDVMRDLYEFLDEYKLSEYTKDFKIARKKSLYEEDVQAFVKKAWPFLRVARILINAESRFIAAYNDAEEAQVYLSSTSEYHKIAKAAIVLSFITDDYKALLEDSFGVKEFDNFEYVKGKVLVKYSRLPKQVQITETFEKEYIDDILQICRLMISASYMQEVQELIAERCIILAKDSDGTTKLMKPSDVYREKSIEGADMRVYYSGLGKEIAFLDEEFYKEKGISTNSVMQLGIHITPVEEGPRIGNGIKAVGDFRPYLEINFLRKNIEYIQDHTNSDLAKKKSACILKIALANATKLAGRVIVGTDDSFETKEGICNALKQLRSDDWLYTDGTLQYIEDISKNQLDKKIYQEIGLSQYSDECRLLGFSADETEIVIDGIDNLDKDAKQQLLRKLAKELGVEISVTTGGGESEIFDPNSFDMNEFPVRYVVNRERLERYVENQFYAADPVRYKEVVVRQKVSGNRDLTRAYLRGMYTNQFGKIICQSCKRVMGEKEIFAVAISNFGVDMEQLNLCLCPNCYQKYEAIKKTRSDEYKASIKRAMENATISMREPYYKVSASMDMSLYFTQTHLAEVQNILQLLDKYGVPMKAIDIPVSSSGTAIVGGKLDEIVVHDGEMIEYETLDDMKTHRVELDIDRYKLHKVMDGRPIGVVFEHEGKQYRITKKL